MSLELSKKAKTKLRFGVGDRVECYDGHNAWNAGKICATFHADASMAPDMCVPYQVEMDRGDRVLAPADDEHVIRKASSRPVELVESGSEPDPRQELMDATGEELTRQAQARENCAVELVGLTKQAALNGRRARTLGWLADKQRMSVVLDDGTKLAVQLANLRFVGGADKAMDTSILRDLSAGEAGDEAAKSAFQPAPAFAGARAGHVFKNGPRGLGYYADAAGSMGGGGKRGDGHEEKSEEHEERSPAAIEVEFPASPRNTLAKPVHHGVDDVTMQDMDIVNNGIEAMDVAESVRQLEGLQGREAAAAKEGISTRAAVAHRLNAEAEGAETAAAAPVLAQRTHIERSYASYRRLAAEYRESVLRDASAAAAVRINSWPWERLDLEIVLMLVGCKPCVVCPIDQIARGVLQPWLADLGSPHTGVLVLRKIGKHCIPLTTDDGATPYNYSGEWVLCPKAHPRRAYIDAAFFPPETLRYIPNNDPVLFMLIGRCLGEPTDRAVVGNVDLAYLDLEGNAALTHMSEVKDDAVFEYACDAPREIHKCLAHFHACRKACAGLLDLGLAMGGRLIHIEKLEALSEQTEDEVSEAFDLFADEINRLNEVEVAEEATLV